MEDNISKIEPTSFDTELIKAFQSNQYFKISNPDSYFSLIEEKLEVVGSMAVGGHLILEKSKEDSIESWTRSITRAMLQYFIDNDISMSSDIIVVGDNMLNYAYRLSASCFLERSWDFFSIPQDTYVIAADGLFFQYTYEDELYAYRSLN